mmetsp:Transcript_36323/g.108592  ORF Transcript_36323/g.108592 Transcript_36323/m.108592 type:complete len:528 (+) Transcript_36323:55-1638(+)
MRAEHAGEANKRRRPGHAVGGRMGRRRGSDLDVLHVLPAAHVDALHHRLHLLHGADLVELRHPVLDHQVDRGLPQDRAAELLGEEGHKLGRGGAGPNLLPRDVHVDVAGGRLHAGKELVQRILELRLGRLHQGSVEGPRRLQQLCLHGTRLLSCVLELVDRALRAGAGEALGEEDVGNLADLSALCLLRAELLEDLLLQTGHREHRLRPRLCRLGHGSATDLYELHALLEGDDARGAESGVLAQREAGHATGPLDCLRARLLQLLEARHPRQEHGRLADARLLKSVFGALEADLHDVEAQDGLGLGNHLLDLHVVPEAREHLHVLRALAGEEEPDRRGPGARDLLRLARHVVCELHRLKGVLAAAGLPGLVHHEAGVVVLAVPLVLVGGHVLLGLLQHLCDVVVAHLDGHVSCRWPLHGVLPIRHTRLHVRVGARLEHHLHGLDLPVLSCVHQGGHVGDVHVDVPRVLILGITSEEQRIQHVQISLVACRRKDAEVVLRASVPGAHCPVVVVAAGSEGRRLELQSGT